MHRSHLTFNAHIISGSHRGKDMGTPTLNLNLGDVPADLKEGIYVCRAVIADRRFDAVMHYGPRPVHKDSTSCEVHILDEVIEEAPERLAVEVLDYLRPVLDFPSEAALIAQIGDDIANARGILETYGDSPSETAGS